MDTIPARRNLAALYHDALSVLEKRLPLPNINPSYYLALAIWLSVLYLYARTPAQKIAIIAAILMADWLDGATARKYRELNRTGALSDVVADRFSEGFIFVAEGATRIGQAFFLLWILNCLLTYYSAWSNKNTTMPLRFAYLIVMVIQLYL